MFSSKLVSLRGDLVVVVVVVSAEKNTFLLSSVRLNGFSSSLTSEHCGPVHSEYLFSLLLFPPSETDVEDDEEKPAEDEAAAELPPPPVEVEVELEAP